MATGLGLYGGPKTAWPSIASAISTTLSINIEIADESAVSQTFTINLEIADESAVSTTLSINYEIADSSIPGGAGGVGGTPDTILNLPTYAKASRLRADFYTWEVAMYPPARTMEYIGSKVGSAPLTSIADFSYNYELDAVGQWSILIPANAEQASVILDGTAEIIKIYFEDVGHIFTGIIDDYEIVDSETMRVVGRDLMFRLTETSAFWRLDTKTIKYGSSFKNWRDYYGHVLDVYALGLFYQFEVNMPNDVIFVGNEEGEFIGLIPAYQSQTILDVLRDFNATSGAHFRISPTSMALSLGAFGDDSGLIIAPIGEDDPKVREEGALVLRSFEYLKTKEELTNMIVVQGSNDSFGIAVELRHADRIFNNNIEYLLIAENEGENTYYFPGGAVSIRITGQPTGDLFPIDLIPQDALESFYEEALNPDDDDTVEIAGGHAISAIGPGTATFASVGYPEDQLVVAIPFTLTETIYPTFASVMNMGGIGQFNMAIVPDSGGSPDVSTMYRMLYSNYFQNTLPGNFVQTKVESNTLSIAGGHQVALRTTYGPSGLPSREDREFGILSEMIGFMDLGEEGFGSNPWPAIGAGDYHLLIWASQSPRVSIPGFPESVHYGNVHDRLRLLKNSKSSPGPTTVQYLGYDGVWRTSTHEVVMSLYGWASSSSYPYAVEGMLAETVKDNGSGHRVFYMRDIQSIRTHGMRQTTVSFPNAIDTSEGVKDIIPASDLLHDQAQVYLENHAQPFEKLTVTCTGLFRLPYVGQKVRFVYRGMALNENGEYKWLDINSDWYVLTINWQINNEGMEHTLTLTNVPDDIVNPRNLTAEFARHIERSKNNLGELQIASRRVGDGIITI